MKFPSPRNYRILCNDCEALTFTGMRGIAIPFHCEKCSCEALIPPDVVQKRQPGALFTRWLEEVRDTPPGNQ